MSSDSVPHTALLWASEVDTMTTRQAWVIDGLIPEGVSMLYGASGTGKTFVALDMAMSIAANEPVWHGRRVEGGPVVYIAAEDGLGVRMRRKAWRRLHGVSDTDADAVVLLDYAAPVYLRNLAQVDAFIRGVQDKGVTPSLIVFDTLARCIPGEDENSSGEMGAALDTLERIRSETGARAVLVIHHTGKGGRGARGSSAIQAAMQGVLRLAGGIAQGVTLRVEKQRNGVIGDTIALTFRDVDGTPVAAPGKERARKPIPPRPTRITQEAVQEVLRRAKTPLGVSVIADRLGQPGSVKAVKDHLRRLGRKGLVTQSDGGYSYVRAA